MTSKVLSGAGCPSAPAPQLHTPYLLEDLCPKPGLHLPVPSAEQMSISGDHAVDRPIVGYMEMQNLNDSLLLPSFTLGSPESNSMAATHLGRSLWASYSPLWPQSSKQQISCRKRGECVSQTQAASVQGRPHGRANACWGAEARVPEDGDLPVIVTSRQELPAG